MGVLNSCLKTQFHVASLDGFGLKNKPAAVAALGAILGYVKESDPQALALFTELNFYAIEDHMVLDEATRRNLELTETILKVSEAGSLLGVLDKTRTPMGKRMIRRWVNQPLIHAPRDQGTPGMRSNICLKTVWTVWSCKNSSKP